MKSPADVRDLDFSTEEELLDIGKLLGQYYLGYFANRFELSVNEHFYADKTVQKKLKKRHFDLVFADCLYTFGRYDIFIYVSRSIIQVLPYSFFIFRNHNSYNFV